jgi:hypothetical protein
MLSSFLLSLCSMFKSLRELASCLDTGSADAEATLNRCAELPAERWIEAVETEEEAAATAAAAAAAAGDKEGKEGKDAGAACGGNDVGALRSAASKARLSHLVQVGVVELLQEARGAFLQGRRVLRRISSLSGAPIEPPSQVREYTYCFKGVLRVFVRVHGGSVKRCKAVWGGVKRCEAV